MLEVWLGAAALTALAAVLVVLGARRRPRPFDGGEAQVLLADRRGEIHAEARVQSLPDADVAALEEDLALAFIADGERSSTPGSGVRPPLLRLLGGAVAAVALAGALYWLWGEPNAPTLAEATRLMADDGTSPEALAELERAIAGRAARRGEDADAWFYLGHLRMRSADYQGAAQAFAELHALTGGSEAVDLTWAQAAFLTAGGVIDDATREIVDRVLERRPEHPNMLELLAMDAIRRSSFAPAAGYLDRALRQTLPAGRRALLDETLGLVRARLDPDRPSIEVSVDVAGADLRWPWLTVFARPVGARMPLAVVKRPTQPSQTVYLDDTVGMGPARQLSDTPVEVVARLSATGVAEDSAVELVSDPVSAATRPRVALAFGAADAAAADWPGLAVELTASAPLPATATVFVIARRPDVPGPPVAVRRLSAAELPTRITLTDRDAMLPTTALSSLEAVEVIARASQAGAPTRSSGDVESAAEVWRPGEAPVALRIEHVVP